MEVLKERIDSRRAMTAFYVELFANIEGVKVLTEPSPDFYSNHWLAAVTIDKSKTGFTREDLRLALLTDNIETRPLWKPMHLQPVFAKAPYYGKNAAEKLFMDGLCLPSGSNLCAEDKERLKISIIKFFNG
jgi:dTDP-4-amino-4,6-dideoxygalactose transaminase